MVNNYGIGDQQRITLERDRLGLIGRKVKLLPNAVLLHTLLSMIKVHHSLSLKFTAQ